MEISAQGKSAEAKWEMDSVGSQAKIMKTTVVCAEWESAGACRESGSDVIEAIRTEV